MSSISSVTDKKVKKPSSKIGKVPASTKKQSSKSPKPVDVLGPVEDLESYVKAEWWRDVFNANYLRTDGDVVNDQEITDMEINRFVEILQPATNSMILDLCCGHGRHSMSLARRGFTNVTGLDRSHYLVKKARKQAASEGLSVVFREGDARKLPFQPNSFDFVLIPGNSFGYFESSKEDDAVLREIRRILKPSGKLLLDLTDGDFLREKFQPRSWEWIDRNYFVCRERCLSEDKARLISREVITHTKKGVVSDQFYAERLYSPDQMKMLLTTAGFRNVSFYEPFTTESKRNQDLGMMERRIIYTAEPKKDWSEKIAAASAFRNIAVIMGDPTKRDTVKPDGNFDEDDFEVINRLKSALGKLENFTFQYFNHHDTLIADGQRIAEEFDLVLNLCDEGFDNKASYELHVPAFLEMLGVPYTGGTPQCLAFCYDKSLVRGIAKEMDIPVPDGFLIQPDDSNIHELTITFPVIVKPNFGDSSVGITKNSVCRNVRELGNAILRIRSKFGYKLPILVEHFLEGKEITVGFTGNTLDNLNPFPVTQEDYSVLPKGLPPICGYEAKWDPTSPYWNLRSIPADLPEETEAFLINSCRRLFERLECRDYARFDWRLDSNGTPRLLEVNPNPGWCWDGHLAKMAKLAGHDYHDMLRLVIEAAIKRYGG